MSGYRFFFFLVDYYYLGCVHKLCPFTLCVCVKLLLLVSVKELDDMSPSSLDLAMFFKNILVLE